MVSVIIVDFKTIQKTCEYIEKLYYMTEENIYHFIIVDNNIDTDIYGLRILKERYQQTPMIEEYMEYTFYVFKTMYGEIIYLHSGSNLGYAKGNNLGTLVADFFYSDEFYLITNNDLRFTEKMKFGNFISIFKRNEKISVIGPRIEGIDGKVQSPYKKVTPFYLMVIYQWSRFNPFHSRGDLIELNHSDYCYRVMGCFMIIRASAFKEVGRFDTNTFMYGEEMILSERMISKGYECYYYNDFTIVHEHGATVKKFANTLRNDSWLYSSLYYYCKQYRSMSVFTKAIAFLNRRINVFFIYIKEILKLVINKIRR